MTAPAKARTKTKAQIANEKRDLLVKTALNRGWQVLNRVADQAETTRLLSAAAKRMKLDIRTNMWDNGVTVTYKVTRKA